MKRSQHFLVTKFNQAMIDDFGKSSGLHNNIEWLNKRFILFKDYCFPSIKGQTYQNFHWLVFFDSDTPEQYQTVILSFIKEFPNFIPIFTKGVASEMNDYKIEIKRYLNDETEILITTRFDSDDALNSTFMDCIQSNIDKKKTDYFINFTYGLQYDINHNVLCRSKQSSNPFLTRVEHINNGTFNTVLQLWSHKDAKKLYSMEDFPMKDMWLQIVHGDNLANNLRLRKLPLFSAGFVNSRFCLNKPIQISFFKGYSFYFKKVLSKLLFKKRIGVYE